MVLRVTAFLVNAVLPSVVDAGLGLSEVRASGEAILFEARLGKGYDRYRIE